MSFNRFDVLSWQIGIRLLNHIACFVLEMSSRNLYVSVKVSISLSGKIYRGIFSLKGIYTLSKLLISFEEWQSQALALLSSGKNLCPKTLRAKYLPSEFIDILTSETVVRFPV